MKDAIADNLSSNAEAARSLLTELAVDCEDEEFAHDVVEGETELVEAVERALCEIDNQQVIVDGCTVRANVLAERRSKAKRRIDRIRALVEQALLIADVPTIKAPTGTVTVRNLPPKRIVTEEADIPAEFWKQGEPVLDSKALKDADLSDEIPGTALTNGSTSLSIRRT